MRRSKHLEEIAAAVRKFDDGTYAIIEKRSVEGHRFLSLSRGQITREHMRLMKEERTARSKRGLPVSAAPPLWEECYGAIGRSIQRLRQADRIQQQRPQHWVVCVLSEANNTRRGRLGLDSCSEARDKTERRKELRPA